MTTSILYLVIALANTAGFIACISERDKIGALLTATGAILSLSFIP